LVWGFMVRLKSSVAPRILTLSESNVCILDVLPRETDRNLGHSKKSLLPIGGYILGGLFGTATNSDLNAIGNQVRLLLF